MTYSSSLDTRPKSVSLTVKYWKENLSFQKVQLHSVKAVEKTPIQESSKQIKREYFPLPLQGVDEYL